MATITSTIMDIAAKAHGDDDENNLHPQGNQCE
jgi:hypothetical protein